MLNWRTVKRLDTNPAANPDGLDQERRFYYSASWQIAEEHVNDDYSPSTPNRPAERIGQHFWGARYIDDAIAKRTMDLRDNDPAAHGAPGGDGWDTSDGTAFYYLTDAQFSVRVIMGSFTDGSPPVTSWLPVRRIDYTPYGEAISRSTLDWVAPFGLNSQLDINAYAAKFAAGTISGAGYDADADVAAPFGLMSQVDSPLVSARFFNTGNVTRGKLSDPRGTAALDADNSVGYAGYWFDHELGLYCVRHRNYDPRLGRWLQRDPIGYVDSSNLFNYVRANPVTASDASGLSCAQPGGGGSTPPKGSPGCVTNNWGARAQAAWQRMLATCAAGINVNFTCDPACAAGGGSAEPTSWSVCSADVTICSGAGLSEAAIVHEIEHVSTMCESYGLCNPYYVPWFRNISLRMCGNKICNEMRSYCREPGSYSRHCDSDGRVKQSAPGWAAGAVCAAVCGSATNSCNGSSCVSRCLDMVKNRTCSGGRSSPGGPPLRPRPAPYLPLTWK
ncbi:MAG: RHS repeat-associated core domain-containing protein [Pseudomonadota bacterium]